MRPTGDLFFPLNHGSSGALRHGSCRLVSSARRCLCRVETVNRGLPVISRRKRCDPGGALFRAGDENVLLSGSFDQARYVYRFAKGLLGSAGYAYSDNKQRMEIRHKATGTRLTVKSSSRARGAFGIVGARYARVADEPGAWDTIGGELMADALDTALGKPGPSERSDCGLHRHAERPAMAGHGGRI